MQENLILLNFKHSIGASDSYSLHILFGKRKIIQNLNQ